MLVETEALMRREWVWKDIMRRREGNRKEKRPGKGRLGGKEGGDR